VSKRIKGHKEDGTIPKAKENKRDLGYGMLNNIHGGLQLGEEPWPQVWQETKSLCRRSRLEGGSPKFLPTSKRRGLL